MAVPKRISLRVLFVLITSVCVALALFASWRRRAQIQEAAVEVLNSNGAKVKYEDERDILESVKVYWWSHYVSMRRSTRTSTAPDRDHWVSRTFGIDYLLAPASVSLGLWRERPTQETLDALANLPDLRYVGAHGSDLADDDLKYLRHHSQIEELRIAYTQVSGDGLGHLACLSNLVILSGPMPRQEDQFVSEQGLTAIAKCTNLQSLSFRVASDEDLNCLRNMSKLRHLNLVGSAINGHGLGYLPTPERLEGLDLADVDLNESVHAPLLKMVNLRAIRTRLLKTTLWQYWLSSRTSK
jgi:hypothetical protein